MDFCWDGDKINENKLIQQKFHIIKLLINISTIFGF